MLAGEGTNKCPFNWSNCLGRAEPFLSAWWGVCDLCLGGMHCAPVIGGGTDPTALGHGTRIDSFPAQPVCAPLLDSSLRGCNVMNREIFHPYIYFCVCVALTSLSVAAAHSFCMTIVTIDYDRNELMAENNSLITVWGDPVDRLWIGSQGAAVP